MGFFQWLGKLLDQLIDWLGRAVANFLERLIRALQNVWEIIDEALEAAFGFYDILYVIFYAGIRLGITIMEVWDPHRTNQPSQVFELKQAPQDTPLPKNRSEAKVLTLEQS